MNDLSVVQTDGSLAVFEPQETAKRQAKIQALVDYATKVRDWPLLQTAIAKKIEEQSEFVRWWKETVSVRHGLNRHSVEISELQSLEKEKAESLTGITAVQVSRWRIAYVAGVSLYRGKRLFVPVFLRQM